VNRFLDKIKKIKERIKDMVVSRSTKAREWSYSRVFPAVSMETESARRDAFAQATTEWHSSAAVSGFTIRKGTATTEAMTPMWGGEGAWTEVNPGDGSAPTGFKVTITGTTS